MTITIPANRKIRVSGKAGGGFASEAVVNTPAPPSSDLITPDITLAGSNTWKVASVNREIDSANDPTSGQPDITVTGTLEDGQSVQIDTSSLDFGQGAEVYLFDDFTGTEIVGNQVQSTPVLGSQGYTDLDSGDILAAKTRGRSHSVYGGSISNGRFTSRVTLPNVRQCFHSLSLFYPETSSWSGSTDNGQPYTPKARYIPSDSTLKVVWYFKDDDYGTGSNICVPTHSQGRQWTIVGNSNANLGSLSYGVRESMVWEGWNTHEGFIAADSAEVSNKNGTGWVAITSPLYRQQKASTTGTIFATGGPDDFNEVSVLGWVDTNSGNEFYLTDLYFASNGARVVVADNENVHLARRKVICPRNGAWGSTQANVMLKLGDIDLSTDAAYLFIYNENDHENPVNTTGLLLNPEVLQ